ncbi:pumilio RNA-binding family [Nematocida sp. AWRm80]|nr:pumilio RNA-binding family [Nematocida sp. AWRm80]
MFKESSTECKQNKKDTKELQSKIQKEYSGSNKKEHKAKETTDIIANAFSPIKCTSWQAKNLVDQIEEDHPPYKSIEYKIADNPLGLPPIGKGIPEKNKGRFMTMGGVKADSIVLPGVAAVSSIKKHQFFEEIQAFTRKRGITSSTSTVVCAISKDQEGSRFIQRKLDTATAEEIEMTFNEIKKWLPELMTDLFGNYVVQKFLEIGTAEQKKEIFHSMEGIVIKLALHMYGCRVIQKALECKEINQSIIEKIKGHVIELICDQNGNHVIQKCVECINSDFIIKEFEQDTVTLSKHRYGCRVIQRIFENNTQCFSAIDMIIKNAKVLVEDQYGNYVIQHILEKGTEEHRRQIISALSDKIVRHSTHKFASNVMEKCVMCGTPDDRRYMLSQLIPSKDTSSDVLIQITCDKFGNYVIQRMLDVLTGKDKELLSSHLKAHFAEIKKSSYAKCIVSKLVQLDSTLSK